MHAERGGVDQHARAGEDGAAATPSRRRRRRDPKRSASASARSRVRLTTVTGAKPRLRSAQTIGARRAAGAEHDGRAGLGIPARRLGIEIGEEADGIGVGADELAVLDPHRVERAGFLRRRLAPGDRGKGRLLVRHGDVAADEAAAGKAGEESDDALRLDRLDDVVAVEAELVQPEAVDHRRARMLDRPADDAGDRLHHDGAGRFIRSLLRFSDTPEAAGAAGRGW